MTGYKLQIQFEDKNMLEQKLILEEGIEASNALIEHLVEQNCNQIFIENNIYSPLHIKMYKDDNTGCGYFYDEDEKINFQFRLLLLH